MVDASSVSVKASLRRDGARAESPSSVVGERATICLLRRAFARSVACSFLGGVTSLPPPNRGRWAVALPLDTCYQFPQRGLTVPKWGFLTNHALVLLELARHPDSTLREIALAVGLTERAVIVLLRALEEEGIVARWRDGRRNRYSVNLRAVMDHLGRQPISPYTLEQVASQLMELAREARRTASEGDVPSPSR